MEAPIKIDTVHELKKAIEFNPQIQKEFKDDPVSAINRVVSDNPLSTDKWVYRIIVLALGSTILLIIIGVIVLISINKIGKDDQVPTILTAIASAAIGSLAGLLAPPPNRPTS